MSADCDLVFIHALLWHNGTVTDLGDFEGAFLSHSESITARGQVVGDVVLPDGLSHAPIWQNSVVTDLGRLPGDFQSIGVSVNNKGQVVGNSAGINDADRTGFLWQNGVMTDLNTLIPADSPRCFCSMHPASILAERS